MKRFKGYSSVLILIFVFIIAISISLLVFILDTNNLVLKNNLDMEQSKYIAESYLNLILSDPDKYFNNTSIYKEESMVGYKTFDEKLFPELEPKVFYKIFEINEDINLVDKNKYNNKIPIYKIIVLSEYRGIEHKISALTYKYSPIFFSELNTINYSRIKTEDNKEFDLYLEKFKNNILYNPEKMFSNQEGVLKNNEFIDALNYRRVFKDSLGRVYINEDLVLDAGHVITIQGVLFLDNCNLTLYNNLNIEGILISNGANVESTDYNINVYGKVIELSETGDLSNVKFYDPTNFKNPYNKVMEHIDKIKAARDYDTIYIKRNDT